MAMRAPVPNPNAGLILCAHCRTWRQPDQLLEVVRIATGVVRFVCRRTVDQRCIRFGVGDLVVDRLVDVPRPDEDPG